MTSTEASTDGGHDLAKGEVEEDDTVQVVYDPPREDHDPQTVTLSVDRVAGGTAAIITASDEAGAEYRVYRDSEPTVVRDGTTLGDVVTVTVVGTTLEGDHGD